MTPGVEEGALMVGASKLMIAALALSSALMLVGYADPVAARQRARVVLDDPSRLLGDDRDAVAAPRASSRRSAARGRRS